MYPKKAAISTSQNLKSKLTLKESLYMNAQIHSQPQSSKGADQKRNDQKQENIMKKKLHNLLGKQIETTKPFKISPTHSQKQHYFVSASVQQMAKNVIQKQNHTENYDSTKTIKRHPIKFIKPQKPKEFNRYYDYLENNDFEIQKQFGNFVKSVEKIQPEQLPSQQHQITERSSLIALFEKLNAKDHENIANQRQTLQDSDHNLFSLKQSIDEDPHQHKKYKKGPLSNNSSGQFCSNLHPNSTTTQLQQNTVEQKVDDNLQNVLDKTKQILIQYKDKLKQAEIEKEQLIQEVIYWKSKYFKSSQRS